MRLSDLDPNPTPLKVRETSGVCMHGCMPWSTQTSEGTICYTRPYSFLNHRTPFFSLFLFVQSPSWRPLGVRVYDLLVTGQQHRPLLEADVLLKCQTECQVVTSGQGSTLHPEALDCGFKKRLLLTFVSQETFQSTFSLSATLSATTSGLHWVVKIAI